MASHRRFEIIVRRFSGIPLKILRPALLDGKGSIWPVKRMEFRPAKVPTARWSLPLATPVCALLLVCAVWQGSLQLTPAATVRFAPISEMSGIGKSNVWKGVYWVQNDSGDSARIFAIRADGSVVHPGGSEAKYAGISIEGAKNVDWEDLAMDGKNLIIPDLGNNANARTDLTIYVVPEPDPNRDTVAKPSATYRVAYPDQAEFPARERNFDCEAVFVWKHKIYMLTKHRIGPGGYLPGSTTKLYRLDSLRSGQVNLLTLVAGPVEVGGWVTAADISPDGKQLAVLTHLPSASILLFPAPKSGDNWLAGTPKRLFIENAKQCEAICYADSNTLLVTNEQRDIFRVPLSAFPK